MSTNSRSCYRRKPLQTYKSPSAGEQIIALSSKCSSSSTKGKLGKFSSSKSWSTRGLGVKKGTSTSKGKPIMVQCRCLKSPALPLFHPLGKLARSLPPLDPTVYGLPVLAVPDGQEDMQSGSGRKKSIRKRSRDVEEEEVSEQGHGLRGVAAVAAQEAKERTSPRKRRTAGGGGGNKRKRKDGDGADGSYPAKKTRVPRGSQNGGDDREDAVTTMEGGDVSDLVEKRRSTRNRGGASAGQKRRESSESETTTGSVSAQVQDDGYSDVTALP